MISKPFTVHTICLNISSRIHTHRYNQLLAEQKKKLKEPLQPFLPSINSMAVSHTEPEDLEKFGPFAPEKVAAEVPATILDGPNSNIPGFTGTPDAVTNKIPDPVRAPVSTATTVPDIPGVPPAVSDKIVELAGVTEVAKDMDKIPQFNNNGELNDAAMHEINTAPALTNNEAEMSRKIPSDSMAAAELAKPRLAECPCVNEADMMCRKRCLAAKEKQIAASKAKHKAAAASIIKNPIVVMIKPKTGGNGKKVEGSIGGERNKTFTSRVCRSWTYFPYFTCLLESPISRPYVKADNSPPFDGPYENCRTLPAFPFFKCYSNGLSEVLPAQRHKISKGIQKDAKDAQKVAKGAKRPPMSPNISQKMSDSVAKAMLENANRLNAKKNGATPTKPLKPGAPPINLMSKTKSKTAKKAPAVNANLSKKQANARAMKAPIAAKLLRKAPNAHIPAMKKSMTKPSSVRPNLFNVKFMLTLPQNKFFVPFNGGIAPNTNLIKPFTALHTDSRGLAKGHSLPPAVFPKTKAKPSPKTPPAGFRPTSIKPFKVPPRRTKPVESKKPAKSSLVDNTSNKNKNTTTKGSGFPAWFNPKTNFNGYIRALLAQHKVKVSFKSNFEQPTSGRSSQPPPRKCLKAIIITSG